MEINVFVRFLPLRSMEMVCGYSCKAIFFMLSSSEYVKKHNPERVICFPYILFRCYCHGSAMLRAINYLMDDLSYHLWL